MMLLVLVVLAELLRRRRQRQRLLLLQLRWSLLLLLQRLTLAQLLEAWVRMRLRQRRLPQFWLLQAWHWLRRL